MSAAEGAQTRSSRRSFVRGSAALAGAAAISQRVQAAVAPGFRPIVDAHIHLFDTDREGGVPWPTPNDAVLYRPALPERYRVLAQPEGVLAAIAVECSPLAADNDWLLRTAQGSEWMVGVIGDLDPAKQDFSVELDRLAANPLFLGIRYGNLWGRDLGAHLDDSMFLDHLRHLAGRSLVLESANPTPQLIRDLLRLATKIPDLRIVIDHLPQAVPPEDRAARERYLATLKELSERPHVFVKGSEIPRRIRGEVPLAVATYVPWLDTLWEMFGEDRVLFGSDWPNSDQLTPINDVFALAQAYLALKGRAAAYKYFWANSIAVYRWQPRNQRQRLAYV